MIVNDVLWNCGNPVSNTVNVVVQSQPTVSVITNDAFICIGGTALLISTPDGGSGSFTYQWQSSPNDNNPWTNVSPGGTSQNLNVPGSAVGTTHYRIIVTDASNNCTDPVSNSVSVTVINQPTATVSTLTPVICIGGTFLISSNVNNGSGLYQYQWQTSGSGSGPWVDITVNGDNFEYTNTSDAQGVRYYRVIITDLASGCGVMTTSSISITTNPNASVTVNPPGQVVCIGGNAALTAVPSNGSGIFTYQWESSLDASTWVTISGATNIVYNPPTGDLSSFYYRVTVVDVGSGCSTPTSAPVFVVTEAQPTVEIEVDNPFICIGGTATISSVVTDGSGTFNYQWQQSNTGTSGWGNVGSNGNNSSYIAPSISSGITWYRLLVSDVASGCADPLSDTIRVTVRPSPSVSIAATQSVICIGGTSLISSTILNGSGFYTYQWQSSTNGAGGPWANITNQGNGSTYSVPSGSPATTHYRLRVTDVGSGCGDPLSNVVPVQVVNQPSVSIDANNDVICVGGTSTITATITNGSGSYFYQWQSGPSDSGPWGNIGTNSSTYILTGSVAATIYYRVIVDDLSNGCNNPISASVSVIVQSGPTVTVSANQDSVCVFGSVELTANVLTGSGFYDFQWQSSTNGPGGPWSNVSGGNSQVLAPSTSSPGV
ncbi:MAG: hypothetical protein ABIT06_08485, partial [Saprospiraceae bacterium]